MLARIVVAVWVCVLCAACTSVDLKGIVDEVCHPAEPTALKLHSQQALFGFTSFSAEEFPAVPTTELIAKDKSISAADIKRGAEIAGEQIKDAKTRTPLGIVQLLGSTTTADIPTDENSVAATTAVSAALAARELIDVALTKAASARSKDGSQPAVKVHVGTGEVARVLDLVNKVQMGNRFKGLVYANLAKAEKALALSKKSDARDGQKAAEYKTMAIQVMTENTVSVFLSRYLEAYFRGGKIVEVSLDTDALSQRFGKDLRDAIGTQHLQDEKLKERVDRVISSIKARLEGQCQRAADNEPCIVSKAGLGKELFVSRSGMQVQFGGFSATIGKEGALKASLTHPATTEFGPQLVRVILEAVFDSTGAQVPAAADSTACALPEGRARLFDDANCLSDSTDGGTKALVQKIDTYGAKAEAIVSAGTSTVIRGGFVAALNNEALAKSTETFAGVLARKIVEQGVWQGCHRDNAFNPAMVGVDG